MNIIAWLQNPLLFSSEVKVESLTILVPWFNSGESKAMKLMIAAADVQGHMIQDCLICPVVKF
jgi:hypothetical protein